MKRLAALALVMGSAWPAVAQADDELPLVPITIQMHLTSDWTQLYFDDVYVEQLRYRIVEGQDAPIWWIRKLNLQKQQWNPQYLRVDFDCVVLGGFRDHHMLTLGKGDFSSSVVHILLGHNNPQAKPFITINHHLKLPHDRLNWRNFTVTIPPSLQGAAALKQPGVSIPPVPVEPKTIWCYRPWLDSPTPVAPRTIIENQPLKPGQITVADFLATLTEADIQRGLDQAKSRGADWVLFEWDGQDTPSERVLNSLLAGARSKGLAVVPCLWFAKDRQALVKQTEHLLQVANQHPAAARVQGKPVVFFSRRLTLRYTQRLLDRVFEDFAKRNLECYKVVEGYGPDLLNHFDGVYCNVVSAAGVVAPRAYVRSYMHARFKQKAFVAAPVPSLAEIQAGVEEPNDLFVQHVAGCKPVWTVLNDERPIRQAPPVAALEQTARPVIRQ